MKEYEKILKALANARRLRILKYLKEKKRAPVELYRGISNYHLNRPRDT